MPFNTLSGPTVHNIGWNPVYEQLLSSSPNQVSQLRMSIAYHGAGHAIVQYLAGVKKLALRMPSFSDTPHIEVVIPLTIMLPCGQQTNPAAQAATELCYHLAGYVAEIMLNDGEYRNVAAMDDLDLAISIADQIGADVSEDAFRILIAAYLVVEEQLGNTNAVLEKLVEALVTLGFVSADEFAKIVKPLKPCDFDAKVLAMLNAPMLDEEMERIERRLA